MNKRLDFVRGIFDGVMQKMIEHDDLTLYEGRDANGAEIAVYNHPAFIAFSKDHKDMFPSIFAAKNTAPHVHHMFQYFIDCDPTDRKKYVQWIVLLFKEYQIRAKENGESKSAANRIGGSLYNFFEDLPKLGEALKMYEYLKLTNTFKVDDKQINKFKNYKDVIDLVQPYMSAEGDANVHTLDHKEIGVLKDTHHAEIFCDTNKHIVVVTKTKEANAEFGKYSSWCTAGTRWGNQMFDSYNNRGPLFVVIKKGFGSKAAIEQNPLNRVQLHFESKSYMDARDRSISIRNLFAEDFELKNAFRHYFETTYLKKITISQDTIHFLLDLGYTDVMMDMLAIVQPTSLNLSNYKIEEVHLKKIFKLKSIEQLDLSSTDIHYLPEEIRHLTNLKSLKLRNNEKLKEIPLWINELKKLEVLDIASCDISDNVDVTGLDSLKQLVADFNVHLTRTPIGIETCVSLERLNLSYCDLENFDISNSLEKLEMVDIHENPNLVSISDRTMINTPHMIVLAAACTKMTKERIDELRSQHKNSELNIVYF